MPATPSPFGSRPQRRAQRRAAQRAKAAWDQSLHGTLGEMHPPHSPGATPNPGSGPQASPQRVPPTGVPVKAGLRPPRRTQTDRSAEEHPPARLVVTGALIVAGVLACLSIAVGAPVLGHGLQAAWLGGGFTGTCTLGWWVHRHRNRIWGGQWTALTAVLLVGLFSWGAATTTIINNRPVLATSTEARAHHLAHELYRDLQTLAEFDELLALNDAAARARYEKYASAEATMSAISRKWTNRLDNLNVEAFRAAAEATRDAAFWGSQAAASKARTVVQTDAALQAQARTDRAAFVQFVLDAGPRLAQAATLYGVDIDGTSTGPVE
jgi:hypothetical protein